MSLLTLALLPAGSLSRMRSLPARKDIKEEPASSEDSESTDSDKEGKDFPLNSDVTNNGKRTMNHAISLVTSEKRVTPRAPVLNHSSPSEIPSNYVV